MNILAIMGSPHGMKGNTGRLLEEVLGGVQHAGGEVELISLAESKVLPCVRKNSSPNFFHTPSIGRESLL